MLLAFSGEREAKDALNILQSIGASNNYLAQMSIVLQKPYLELSTPGGVKKLSSPKVTWIRLICEQNLCLLGRKKGSLP